MAVRAPIRGFAETTVIPAEGRGALAANGDRALAIALVFLVPLERVHYHSRSLNIGLASALVFAPILIPAIRDRFQSTRLALLLSASIVSAPVLIAFSVGEGRAVDRSYAFGLLGYLFFAVAALGVLAFASSKLSMR